MFSSSLAISAVLADETGYTASTIRSYAARATSAETAVTPPTTLGICPVLMSRPGSTRSGENATYTSSSSTNPPEVAAGMRMSSVVPGYVVDSRETSMPGLTT